MESNLLAFLRSRGATAQSHGMRSVLRHCQETSKGNPMACVHGQPDITLLMLDSNDWKKMAVVGMYAPIRYGGVAVLRRPEIVYHLCEGCEIPISYYDDVYNVNMTLQSDGVERLSEAADGLLEQIKQMRLVSASTIPSIIAVA